MRTAAGGGQAGPLRIDVARGRHVVQVGRRLAALYSLPWPKSAAPAHSSYPLAPSAPVQEYGLAEAHAAFQRTVANHGWTTRSAGRAAVPSAAATNGRCQRCRGRRRLGGGWGSSQSSAERDPVAESDWRGCGAASRGSGAGC